MHPLKIFTSLLLIFANILFAENAYCDESPEQKIDQLMQQLNENFRISFAKSQITLDELNSLESHFTKAQRDQINLVQASVYGFQGKHQDRARLILGYLHQVSDPNVKAKFIGQLISSYTILGEYEKAIYAMIENNELLPKLSSNGAKKSVLQGSITLLRSMKAYDEALLDASRLLDLKEDSQKTTIKCLAILNIIDLNYLRGDLQRARSLTPEADAACKTYDLKLYLQILHSLTVVDLVNSGSANEAIKTGLPLLGQFEEANNKTENRTRLEEALARAYLSINNLQLAYKYGKLAFDHAAESNAVEDIELTSETLAKIKDSQGKSADALAYLHIAFENRKLLTEQNLQKKLAYQRVKFDLHDKASQLNLLELKNKALATERDLERENSRQIYIIAGLTIFILCNLIAALFLNLRYRNKLATANQIDKLTQVSSRAFFIDSATKATVNQASDVHIILLNLDRFKNINETYGYEKGDQVLAAVGARIKALMPRDSHLGRLDVDEFSLCLIGANEEFSIQIAQNCRKAVLELDLQGLKLTASIGVATFNSQGLATFKDTLNAARDGVLRAKNIGGNCVISYQKY